MFVFHAEHVSVGVQCKNWNQVQQHEVLSLRLGCGPVGTRSTQLTSGLWTCRYTKYSAYVWVVDQEPVLWIVAGYANLPQLFWLAI